MTNNFLDKKILLADDHSLVRMGIVFLFTTRFGCSQADIDEVESLSDLMAALKRHQYTHLILDLVMDDGVSLEILPNIRSLYPTLQIAIFSMQPVDLYQSVLDRYGIKHFVSKSLKGNEVTRLLQSFLNDEEPLTPLVEGQLSKSPFDKLSPREFEVMHYVLLGLGSVEIGNKLNMENNTVSTYKKRIFEKTDTTNVVQLKELAAVHKFKV